MPPFPPCLRLRQSSPPALSSSSAAAGFQTTSFKNLSTWPAALTPPWSSSPSPPATPYPTTKPLIRAFSPPPARRTSNPSAPEFTAALQQAKGIWFNGGRQWRFVDAYMGTKAEELFHDFLRRGGVIGGTSAGASIQGQYMPRGSPLGNLDMMADGYERGLNFLPGVAIDQHFTQRKRHADMTALMRRYPQLLGIGIDESTALVIQASTAQILGRGHVHFYDYLPGPLAGPTDYVQAKAGQKFDLANRVMFD
jgi:cyanophycinase